MNVHCDLAPGIEIMFFSCSMQPEMLMSSAGSQNSLELFFCLQGRIRMNYHGGSTCLHEDMIGIYNSNCPPDEVIVMDKMVQGLRLTMDCDRADEMAGAFLGAGVMTMREMMRHLTEETQIFRFKCDHRMTEGFRSIACNPLEYHIDYLQLKVMELIVRCSEGMRSRLQGRPPFLRCSAQVSES